MKFTHRIAAVAAIITLIRFRHYLWDSESNGKDSETKVLRLIKALETQQKEYEAMIQSLRQEMLMLIRKDEKVLVPTVKIGKGRKDVSFVIGIPTVKRQGQGYLLPTLRNLINSMLPSEMNDTLILVFIAESNVPFVQATANLVTKYFKKQVESGLIEIISPSANYYPDFEKIKGNLGDSDNRTRWRTKQNLDYVYLMLYAQHRGKYYVQLEDDILSKKGFVNSMKSHVLKNYKNNKNWAVLDFCQLGFIGKLFRSTDLWKLMEFFLIFYQDKPGDWLLRDFFTTKYCGKDLSDKNCTAELRKYWIQYYPSLFQHIGTISSLNGKVQKLQDMSFIASELFTGHDNPSAKVKSSIKHHESFSLEKAYKGENYFWGLLPMPGDTIIFTLDIPTHLKKYRIVSGNEKNPLDILQNATFEILPANSINRAVVNSTAVAGKDGFVLIDEFDELGILDGQVPEVFNPVSAVRITVRNNNNENSVILSEILLEKSSS